MVSAYCLGYQNFTVIPHQMEEDFKEMVDMGFDAVCLTFTESEMVYSRRAFEIQVNLARKAGLKIIVIPSRIVGRFAGAPLMASTFLAKNPQFAIQTGFMPIGCLEIKEVRDFVCDFMKTIIHDYDVDGIIWDEPKDPSKVSYHKATLEKYGDNPTPSNMINGFVEFFGEITEFCQKQKNDIIQTLFVQATDPQEFREKIVKLNSFEYYGYDGNLSRQSYFHEEPFWNKYRLESVWENTLRECKMGNKKTFALVENMLMPKEVTEEFELNFENYLQNYKPDHLGIYYYAHNNEDPEAVHSVVRRLMKQYLK